MFKKILVPLDSSDLAEYALQPAVWMAQQTNGEVTLLHILEHHTVLIPEGPEMMGHSLYYPETNFSQEEAASREYLNNLQYGLGRTHPDLNWNGRIEEGDPAAQIVDVAAAEESDLIVMSTHGYSGMTRWVLGSVAEKVLPHAPCPVFIVRSQQSIQHILIALDGSPLAETSLPLGLDIAQAFDTNVTLLRVEDNSYQASPDAIQELNQQESGLGERYRHSVDTQTAQYLHRIAVDYGRTDLNLEMAVGYGKPAPTILQFVEEQEIDLVVMSTHGRTGLSRWRYGSVAEKVLRGVGCAMLINRPHIDDFRNP
ncbi:MAG: universal stress protein [Chloroflexi bacterium]|nr:universal stress protein [Chloroflexota bacterium]